MLEVTAKRRRRGRAAIAALTVLAIPLNATESGVAAPDSACREVICTGGTAVGPVRSSWTSPQVFYPNNEDVFASVKVGKRVLAEVRRYGPALCRHRFVGASTTVVIKACAPAGPVRVRAVRSKRGVRNLWIYYSARPMVGGDGDAPTTGTIYRGLTQITGLVL